MREISTFGQNKNGKTHYTHLEDFKVATLSNFKEGERFLVIHKKLYKQRSNAQNNYWYGIVVNCALDGYRETEGHEFGTEFTNKKTGEIFFVPFDKETQIDLMHEMLLRICNLDDDGNVRRSRDNSTTQQMEMIDKAIKYIKFAYNVDVPLPGEQSEIDFKHNEQ